jgi:hypothetical protein
VLVHDAFASRYAAKSRATAGGRRRGSGTRSRTATPAPIPPAVRGTRAGGWRARRRARRTRSGHARRRASVRRCCRTARRAVRPRRASSR